MGKPTYPFVPKSNRYLIPGQFWAIPLSNGMFAAGRVVEIDPRNRTCFLVGLMDWVGPNPPTSEDLAGRRTLTQGEAHYVTILDTGGEILGHRPLELDGIEPDLMLAQAGWPGAWVKKGLTVLRLATREEWATLPVCLGWGRVSIRVKAERVFVEGRPLVTGSKTDLAARLQRRPLH